MNRAYAATEGAAHGEGHSVGDAILHHVQDTDVFDLWPLPAIPLPKFELFGINFSITKHLVMMWIASALLIIVFKRINRQPRTVPSGLSNLLEAIVVFLRDEVVLPTMGEAGKHYLPFFLTVFFFILTSNLLGLIPYGATATGNVTVTVWLGASPEKPHTTRDPNLAVAHHDPRRNHGTVYQAFCAMYPAFCQYDRWTYCHFFIPGSDFCL
jgi:F-type H+-transporting ATPase subunit a